MQKEKGNHHAEFFLKFLDRDIFMKIFEFQDSNFMKERKRKMFIKTDPVQLEMKLFIKKSESDELTLDNLYHSRVPLMI